MSRTFWLALTLVVCAVWVCSVPLTVNAADPYDMDLDELYRRARAEGKVVFYTSQVGVQEQQVVEGFRARYPGIDVEIVYAGGGALYQRIVEEAQAGRSQADVHLQSDIALIERLRQSGLLAQWYAPEMAHYPDEAVKDGYYTAVAYVVNLIIYNKFTVSEQEAPKSWEDLLDPKWRGRIAALHVGGGGLPWSKYYFLRNHVSEDYWARLAANQPTLYDGGGAVVNAVVSGMSDVGMVAASVSYGSVREGAPIVEVAPIEGAPGVEYSMAVLKDAPHPHAARLFLNWYLSQEGQSRLVALRGVASPRADVAGAPGGLDLAATRVFIPTLEETQPIRDAWSEEWFNIFRYRP